MGFTFKDVYNLPIMLRNYYTRKISKIIEDRNNAMKRAKSKRGRKG